MNHSRTGPAGRAIAPPVRATLADGREILFYADDPSNPTRPGIDRRDLPARPVAPTQLRRDPRTGSWVIIAPARGDRTYKPARDMCPLCPDPTGRSSEIPGADYDVAVFENRFPSLTGVAAPEAAPVRGVGLPRPAEPSDGAATGIAAPGFGRCEVVCFTSTHDGSFAGLGPRRARLMLDVWAHRTEELLADDGIAEVFCFENRGEEIGVTLTHPHGQIYAYPFATPRTEAMTRAAAGHRAATGTDLFESILSAEVNAGDRLVARSEFATAFVPYAARWPAEVHIYPHRHVRRLAELTDAEADDLARTYLTVLRAYDALYDAPLPYVASWHQYRAEAAEGYLHAELFSVRRSADKLKYLAGSESGRDVFITDRTPEDVAADLRDALRRTAPVTDPTDGAR